MRIVVATSDKYIQAVRPLAHLLNKYWPQHPPVLVGGFSAPPFKLPLRFTFHSIGSQSDYPIHKWSDGIIQLLRAIDDEAFIFILEDMWPVRRVNHEAIRILYDYVLQFRNVARMDLTDDRFFAGGCNRNHGTVSYLDLVKSDPGSQYHASMMPGIWNRKHFLSILVAGETPWQIELEGTSRLRKRTELDVLGTRQLPYKCTLAFRGGDSGKLACEIPYPLSTVDREEMAAKGLLDSWL